MNNYWLWFVFSAFGGALGFIGGYLLTPLFIDGQILRADILGSLGTWAGSIATVGTLIFLIRQNIELSKRQDEQQKKQENTVRMQQGLWEKQIQSLNVKAYHSHQSEFIEVINSIERRYSKYFFSFNKKDFYNEVFPNNSRNKIEYELTDLDDKHPLKRSIVYFEHCISELIILQSSKAHFEMINNVFFNFSYSMHMIPIARKEAGEITINDKTINIFKVTNLVMELSDVMNQIRDFCELKYYHKQSNTPFYSSLIIENLLHFYSTTPQNSSSVKVNFGHFNLLKVLSKTILTVKANSIDDKEIKKLINIEDIRRGFTIENINDKGDVKNYLNKLITALHASPPSSWSNELIGLINFIEEQISNQ